MTKETKPDLKAVPKGEAEVMKSFIKKKNNIKITFKRDALNDAINAREQIGLETPNDFFGPDFHDIKGYQIVGPMLCVALENVEYVYPLDSIARLKLYITE